MKKISLGTIAALLAGMSLLSACATTLNTKADAKRGKPEWVVRGGGVFQKDGNVVFYGVGDASAMPNVSLQRKTADMRAREAIAATLKTSMQSMLNDFMQHSADYFKPNGEASSKEFVDYVAKATSDAELSNCRILDYWENPETGSLHAIAKLDLKDGFYGSYKANLEKALRPGGPGADIKGAEAALKVLDTTLTDQKAHALDVLGAKTPAPAEPVVAEPAIDGVSEPKP